MILCLLITQLDIQGVQKLAIVHLGNLLIIGVRNSEGEIHIFDVQDIRHVGLQVQVFYVFISLRDRLSGRLRDLRWASTGFKAEATGG